MSAPAARVQTVLFEGPAGALEGIFKLPPGDCREVALLCHPHPLYKGSMHSPVIFRAARVLHRKGAATLRFNFRGVGRSGGEFDEGVGERGDVLAALDFLAQQAPQKPVSLLGYSFGARVGFEAVASDPRVDSLIGIGMPLALGSFDFLVEPRKPLLAVQGERDEFGDPRELERLMGMLGSRSKLIVVAGADHLFTGCLDRFEENLEAALSGFNGRFP